MLFVSGLAFSQMPNIEKVWLNNSQPYHGTIGNQKQEIKLKINVSEQNKKDDQEYFVAGYSLVDRNYTKFEGKIKITKYRNGKKKSVVFGEYDFAEEPKGQRSGTMKGKFVYSFRWNSATEKIDSQFIKFIGDWSSYDHTLKEKTILISE